MCYPFVKWQHTISRKVCCLSWKSIFFKCAAVLLLAGVLLSCHSTCVQLFISTILSVKLLTTDGVCHSCWALSVADTNINTSEKNVFQGVPSKTRLQFYSWVVSIFWCIKALVSTDLAQVVYRADRPSKCTFFVIIFVDAIGRASVFILHFFSNAKTQKPVL